MCTGLNLCINHNRFETELGVQSLDQIYSYVFFEARITFFPLLRCFEQILDDKKILQVVPLGALFTWRHVSSNSAVLLEW